MQRLRAWLDRPGPARLGLTIAIIAGAWSLASLGYFRLLPVLGAEVGYNDAPVFFATYYAAWAAVIVAVFRAPFQRVAQQVSAGHAAAVAAMVILFGGYALFLIPRLPATEWSYAQTPVEFFWANSWYFLPKSVEILFQQVLIAALVLALDALGLTLRRISVLIAVLFGGFHLTLALAYPNPLYVARYSVAATIFGAMVPWFLLRLRGGFLISYTVHWSYYAADIAAIHFAFASGD